MSVYEKKELVEQSSFQKMFKKQPKQNFIIELENALYEYEDKLLTLDISIINSLKQNIISNQKILHTKESFC